MGDGGLSSIFGIPEMIRKVVNFSQESVAGLGRNLPLLKIQQKSCLSGGFFV